MSSKMLSTLEVLPDLENNTIKLAIEQDTNEFTIHLSLADAQAISSLLEDIVIKMTVLNHSFDTGVRH